MHDIIVCTILVLPTIILIIVLIVLSKKIKSIVTKKKIDVFSFLPLI